MRIFESGSFTVDSVQISSNCSELIIKGEAWCIWPNREGEGFHLSDAAPALSRLGCRETGISLSWPATASCCSLLLETEEDSVLIDKEEDPKGYHEEIRIFADSPDGIRFRFTGSSGGFTVNRLNREQDSDNEDCLTKPGAVQKQFQLGLIGPEGENNLPPEQGFRALVPLARNILESFPLHGEPPVLHIFGYAAGHDRGYPDYSPSQKLGGPAVFKEILSRIKSLGFRISLYMNARLMDSSLRGSLPHLEQSILRSPEGTAYSEEYFGRTFLVMDPSSPAWIEELYNRALELAGLGADLIQLDQIAGRAAPAPPGTPWGEGYAGLIRRIQSSGTEVWIQGVSSFYPADAFELTWKNLEVLEGGVLRGGNPFGINDLGLLKVLKQRGRFRGTLLVPIDKGKLIDGHFPFRLDLMDKNGLLPLYGPDYISNRLSCLKGFPIREGV
ncbi:MAG: DUF6259 domain-containing protein [Spirochaetales bacterium]|nr:DUF6259 domain-containing protein [Spirochaetales bacterium]